MSAAAPDSIYLIAAHPDWRNSRVTRRLLKAARGVADAGRLVVNDLYTSYPDYAIDVQAEQARLQQASLVVLLFPLHWYASPALLKLWLDEVLTYGWAYGLDRPALEGKTLWIVTSAGGPEDSYQPGGYNRHAVDEYLLPWRQAARLCGMHYAQPQVLLSAHRVGDADLAIHTDRFTEALKAWPQWQHGSNQRPLTTADREAIVPSTDRRTSESLP